LCRHLISRIFRQNFPKHMAGCVKWKTGLKAAGPGNISEIIILFR
jgi:hypothetical protein